MSVQMQARSDSDGLLYTWVASGPDFAAAGYPGPGSPLDVAISMRPSAAAAGGGLTVSGTPSVGHVPTWDGSEAIWASATALGGGSGGDGFDMTFQTSTVDGDPGGPGGLRFSSATIASIAQLYIDLGDTNGNTITTWLDALDDAADTIKGRITVRSKTDKTRWIEFLVTGVTTATGYRKVSVTPGANGGSLPTTTAGDTVISFDCIGTIGTMPLGSLTPGGALQEPRTNAAGTAVEWFSPVYLAQGATLGDASVTLAISGGSQYAMLPGTTTATRTLTLGTSGTPELDEGLEVIIYAQGNDVVVVNGGPAAGTLWTILAGTKRSCRAQWDGTDWFRAGKDRLS